MKILLVEDDKNISKMIRSGLSSDAFTVEIAEDGNDGSFLARSYEYDAIVLDYSLPKKSGLILCREIRSSGKSVPILFLSVMADVDTKIAALDSGADDYMTKPFSMSELKARLHALTRRPQKIKQQNIINVADLEIDTTKQVAKRAGNILKLTRKEYSMLEYMMRNAGMVLSRSSILEHVWTADSDPFSNTVEAHIRNLRKKVNIGKKSDLIRNIPGRGYIIDKP